MLLLSAIDFHYMDNNSWDILRNIFFCVSQKKECYFILKVLEWHLCKQIMIIVIIGWTIPWITLSIN